MNLNQRPVECVNVYANSLRKTIRLLTKVVEAVKRKIQRAKENQESIDYLTFVPDGEPTLDENLGKEIDRNRI